MVEMSSDQNIDFEDLVQCWLADNSHHYEDHFIVTLHMANSKPVVLEVEDFTIKLHLDDGVPCEMTTKSRIERVLNWIEACNEKMIMREFLNLKHALQFILDKYKTIKTKSNNIKSSEKINKKNDQDYGGEDADMTNEDEDGEDDAWNQLDGDGSDDEPINYQDIISQQAEEEEMQIQKKFGKINGQNVNSKLFNMKAVKAFESTKYYEQALEAQEYINKNESKIKGWLNVVIVKEFMTVRLEIDLNFVDISQINAKTLGWNMDEPLIITLSGKECKLLNVDQNERSQLSFIGMWNNGMLEYNCSNNGKEDSFGCKDYIRSLYKTFVEQKLYDSHQEPYEEEKSAFDDTPSENIVQKVKSNNHGFFQSWKNKITKEKVNDEALGQLVEMGFEFKQAKKALKNSSNDIMKALDQLKVDGTKDNKKMGEESSGYQIIDRRIMRQIPATSNPLIQLMFFVTNQLESMTSMCFICLAPLESVSFKLRTCNNDYCEYTFEETFTGQVYPALSFATAESHFDLSIASWALFSTRANTVVEPFPTFFLKNFELRTKRGYLDEIQKVRQNGLNISAAKKINEQNKDILQMANIFSKLPNPKDLINHCTDDKSLLNYLKTTIYQNNLQDANKAYKLMAYILATNRSAMRQLEKDESVILSQSGLADSMKQFLLTPQDPNKERIFQQRKQQKGSFFCWHGSSLENWYSILRNGLRNLSNSHMMTAGQAYGQGIYASSNFGTSMGYSTKSGLQSKQWTKACHTSHYIIGVVEIINVPEYKKDPACNIVVVPNDDDMILRYINLFNGHNHGSDMITTNIDFEKHYYSYVNKLNLEKEEQKQLNLTKAYSKYVERKNKEMEHKVNIENEMQQRLQQEEDSVHDKKLEQMKNKISGKGSAMATERIMIEYKGLLRSKDFKDIISIDFKNNNMYTWQVIFDITKYEIGADLKEDFKKWASKFNQPMQIEYEVIFSDSYPFSPPFVRVVAPRFMYQTGHITVGGSICMESLTSSGWSSARSLESYYVEILSLLNIGNAKLDLRMNQPYTIYEAKEAFQRVAKQHGWEK